MQTKLRMAKATWERLRSYHFSPGKKLERISFLWARAYQDGRTNTTVIVPHNAPLFLFADDCYSHQSAAHCRLMPAVLNGMLVLFAASDYNTLINIHDHWFDQTTHYSGLDDADDLDFDSYLRGRFEPMLKKHPHIGTYRPILNISIVLAKRGCEARVINTKQKNPFSPLASLDVLGESYADVPSTLCHPSQKGANQSFQPPQRFHFAKASKVDEPPHSGTGWVRGDRSNTF